MLIDVRGKVAEKKLAYNNALLPLFEALVNSIHAIIENSVTKPGEIKVEIIRANQKNLGFPDQKFFEPISDFIICDNGCGFDEKNFQSFNRAHSTYKISKGGKGVGRFIWLKAFEKVEIESVYPKNGTLYYRQFNFEATEDGIENLVNQKAGIGEYRYTKVHLKNMKADYRQWCNTDPEKIAYHIIEHCFVYFLNRGCPKLTIVDGENKIIINDLFKNFTKGKVTSNTFQIRNQAFKVNLVKLYDTSLDNKIHYCAHTREVQNERISTVIPEMDDFLIDSEEETFSIAAYVSGKFLDENVNEERTQIAFSKNYADKVTYPDEITQEEIRDKVVDVIKSEFSDIIDNLSAARLIKVQEFIQRHPRYRQLLKYKEEDLRKVPSTLNDEKFEIELFQIQQRLDYEVKIEATEILRKIENIDDLSKFEKKYDSVYNKIIEVGNSKLSEYVLHRKLVLDLLDKHIKVSNEGKFATEDTIHKLIFPLRSFSDDVGFEEHNLWVIDERLAFHKYLASDKKFKNIKGINSKSNDRPDILIFNRPFAFSENNKPYSSVVIIEFKRPMRDDYTEEENPINQVVKYTREIIENLVKDKNEKTFDLRPNTPMYAYIICDLTPKLRATAKDAGFTVLPDNDGYFSFNSNYGLYVEVISFDKLIKDSKQRNKALFEKLNLTSI
jgi:hypothetical protein